MDIASRDLRSDASERTAQEPPSPGISLDEFLGIGPGQPNLRPLMEWHREKADDYRGALTVEEANYATTPKADRKERNRLRKLRFALEQRGQFHAVSALMLEDAIAKLNAVEEPAE